jgi:spore germination protein YaaH
VLPGARSSGLTVIAFTDARPSPAARGSLSAHLGSLDAVAPAWLALGPGGTIAYHDADAFTRGLTARGAALYPELRDPGHRIGALVADRHAREQTAARLVAMTRALGAQGLVVNLGHVPASARTGLPSFLRELRSGLPARDRLLLVVPPIDGSTAARRESGYDLRDLARPATLVVQAFGGPGHAAGPHPIASLAWYKRVVRYTLAHAPRAKVMLALPTWGAVWDGGSVHRATQAALFRLARTKALLDRDGTRVVARGGMGYVESDRSLQLKLEVARAAHVAGVALFVRGGESTGVWREPIIAPPAS